MRRQRSYVLGGLLLSTAAAFASCRADLPPVPEQPNVLLYVVDTLRADGLTVYGNPAVETPVIDALAEEGIVYEHAFAASSWTRASIATLLSGLQPDRHRVQDRDDRATPEVARLATAFRDAGWRTGAIVTNPNVGRFFGFGDGFDDYVELFEHQRRDLIDSDRPRARADEVTRRAIEWIAQGREPWLLFVLVTDPHEPYAPPEGFDRYALTPEQIAQIPPAPQRERRIANTQLLRRYWGEIDFTDAALGPLVEHLEATGALDRTIVALTADHGEHFGEHGWMSHGQTLYQEVLHIPLVLRLPGGRRGGQRIEAPVQLVDLHRTLLELAGLGARAAPADALPGDARPLPLDAATATGHAAYAQLDLDGHRAEMIFGEPWKYVRPLPGQPSQARRTDALFDLSAERGEYGDERAEKPEVVARLRAQLDARAARSRRLREALAADADADAAPVEAMPEDVRRALEHLGYIEATSEPEAEAGAEAGAEVNADREASALSP